MAIGAWRGAVLNNYETPRVIPTMCGFCYPDVEFDSYIHEACASHNPSLAGADDEAARARFGTTVITGTSEAGGEGNQAICEAIHHRPRA